ncbi:MAG: tRNA (adenosine(37)-N6)-dimethylallyltransferase MiaA [Lachnospira sp.]|nr:tRNA (adenosine(37)-N6)-dimethylallyltransferase MiaA [Lachnospira sp.]
MQTDEGTRQKAVVIAGPTASGKSSCAVALCRMTGGAVLSMDSMQIYRHMDIGTAKVTKEEMQGVRHYLIDILNPDENCSISDFQAAADAALAECRKNGVLPVLAGGTGFYLHAVVYGNDFGRDTGADRTLRDRLQTIAMEQGAEALHHRLEAVDPEAAASIHPNNVKRVIRALEYYEETGRPISAHNLEEKRRMPRLDFAGFLLQEDRARLYERINRRVDMMREAGLTEEVRGLLSAGIMPGATSLQAIGYKEIVQYLEGKCTEDEAYEAIRTGSRHYAKRQNTWFKREAGLERIDIDAFDCDPEKIAGYMLQRIKEKGILT